MLQQKFICGTELKKENERTEQNKQWSKKKPNDFASVQAVKILNKYSVGTVNNISFVVWLELKPRGPGELLVFISSPFLKDSQHLKIAL